MDKSIALNTRLLRVSTTRVDGGCVFGALPKERWEQVMVPDRQNRVGLANYSMLVQHPAGWVLVNAGPGDKAPLNFDSMPMRSRSSLLRELREMGLAPKDIAFVIMTHMHDEYSGGGTHVTSSGRVLPTFPNARYIIQRAAIQEALRPNERSHHFYRRDDVQPVLESNQLMAVDGQAEILPGLWVEPTPGPTAGHQSVFVRHQEGTSVFLGSLVPTPLHLSLHVTCASDWNPDLSLRSKCSVFQRAIANNWQVAPAGLEGWVSTSELESRMRQPVPKPQRLVVPEPVESEAVAVA
ncbi:MAG: MBL fold metallo-hydrolase [SAR202 cluster bacterium]|nr:MBL fold metallo-hydrolase [SAR202 cluster bacterium]